MFKLTLMVLALWAVAIHEVVSVKISICWSDSEDRGAGTIPKGCHDGDELDGALCFPKCQAGYYGVGPVCWQSCPAGWHDGGIFCYKGGQSFAKKSYGRTAGYVPLCPAGEDEQLALCYHPCSAGFEGFGPVCLQNAPDTDFPVACKVKLPLPIPIPLPVPLAYGVTDTDCTLLNAALNQTGDAAKKCVSEIVSGGIPGFEQCIKDLAQSIPDLATTKTCPAPIVSTTQAPPTSGAATTPTPLPPVSEAAKTKLPPPA